MLGERSPSIEDFFVSHLCITQNRYLLMCEGDVG